MFSDIVRVAGGSQSLMTSHQARGGQPVPLPPLPQAGGQNTMEGPAWFGPLRPMAPVAPPEVAGRRTDYPAGWNLQTRPRQYEEVTFAELRALADNYDLMRLVIETRKDQIARLKWTVTPRDKTKKVEKDASLKARVLEIKNIFVRPDRTNFWGTWIRSLLEDLLVIDAPAVHVRRTMDSSEIWALDQIDGATVKRVIDDYGRTPEPPFAAYQQILKGLPAVNYSTQDLVYRPRNVRVHKFYGFSPVEQVLMTVNIALRRQMWQLAYFTDGNLPDSLIGVPSTWTPDQIRQFQDWFDSLLLGNINGRRSARFVPGEVAKSYVPTKEAEIFGGAEEWLARVMCYAFGVSHQALVKEVNRATADSAYKMALEEGLAPVMAWVKEFVDTILMDHLGAGDLEFAWVEDEETDPKVQSEIFTSYVGKIMSINEIRVKLGEDPDPSPEADMLGTFAADGTFTPLSLDEAIERKKRMMEEFPPPVMPSEDPSGEDDPPDGDPKPPGKTKDKPPSKDKSSDEGGASGGEGEVASAQSEKSASPEPCSHDHAHHEVRKGAPADKTPVSVTRPAAQRALRAVRRSVEDALDAARAAVVAQVRDRLESLGVGKATPVDFSGDLDLSSLEVLLDDVGGAYEKLALDTAMVSLAMIGVEKQSDLVDVVNERAVRAARDSAARLVGKRILDDGTIIDNPDPKWAITESTRDMVRDTITRGLEDNLGSDAIIAELEDAYAFSPARAEMISRTEIADVNSQASMETYREARDYGVKLKKSWILGEDPCEICQANADQGSIPLDDEFDSGDDTAPAHPNCECAVIPEVEEDDSDE